MPPQTGGAPGVPPPSVVRCWLWKLTEGEV